MADSSSSGIRHLSSEAFDLRSLGEGGSAKEDPASSFVRPGRTSEDKSGIRYAIVGTAGHVDHGKTTLVRALSGVDTDRLKEEKERGLSIELGFAPLSLPSGRTVGVVDVPGHERFIRHMAAGAVGMDLVLLVVAADEGVKPQTVEHLDIASLFDAPRGIVVLTKIDLASPERLSVVEAEVGEAICGTFLESAPMVRVSAQTGAGLDDLSRAIDAVLDELPERDRESPVQMAVDRVFTMRGHGTVVTGTLARGTLREGEELHLLPSGTRTRARQVQVHGHRVKAAFAGQRVAVNLADVSRNQVRRGEVLAEPGFLAASQKLDVRLRLLPRASGPLEHMDRVRVHIGTAEIIGRAALLGTNQVEPGGSALAQLRLEEPTAAAPGDRFVLRTFSPPVGRQPSGALPRALRDTELARERPLARGVAPLRTIGGGRVILPDPPLRTRAEWRNAEQSLAGLEAASPEQRVARTLEMAGEKPVPSSQLYRRAGLLPREGSAALATLVERGDAVLVEPVGRQPSGALPRALRDTELARERPLARGATPRANAALAQKAVALAAEKIADRLRRFHAEHPLRTGLPKADLRSAFAHWHPDLFREALSTAVGSGRVVEVEGLPSDLSAVALAKAEASAKEGERLALADHRPEGGETDVEDAPWRAAAAFLRERGLGGATAEEAADFMRIPPARAREILGALIDLGRAVRAGERYLDRESLDQAIGALRQHFREGPSLRVSEFRDRLGSSRKVVVPLLEYFDTLGLTIRRGDERFPGPGLRTMGRE